MEKKDTYHYVPLLSSLKRLLQDKSVTKEIDACKSRVRTSEYIEDFCDGSLFKNHPLFSQDDYALQIVAFYDEVELCNPLGSHVKRHKLGVVFYTLSNISPKYRSSLRMINLAIIATVPVVEKYGIDKVMRPFITDLNTLRNTGVTVSLEGVQRTYKGALLAFLADNLASNLLGGFKLSFSFAYRYCRTCLVTHEQIPTIFDSDSLEKRSLPKHLEQCRKVEADVDNHYSKTYGINRRTSLLDIEDYSIFDGGLPHDIMHDVFEGVAPLEIKLLLQNLIQCGCIHLNDFNKRLSSFDFGYSETHKPPPILNRTLSSGDKSLKSFSASQMILLVRILPFLVADKVDEDNQYWQCFLLLRKIVDIVLCPISSESISTSLKLYITDHHKRFVSLYGTSYYTPKMHFIIHYPEQILAVGPMVRTWTIRHEAKLNFFKQASHLANFKNITYTLACRHERWMCYQLATGCAVEEKFQFGPPVAGSRVNSLNHESADIQEKVRHIMPHVSSEASFFRPTWMKIFSVTYQPNNAFLIIGSDGLDPIFARLDDLLVIDTHYPLLLVSVCDVLYFDSHFHAFVITVTTNRQLLCHGQLKDHNIYHATNVGGRLYISLRYYFVP